MKFLRKILIFSFIFCSLIVKSQTEAEDSTYINPEDEEYWIDEMEVEDHLVLDSTAQAFYSWVFPNYRGEEPAFKLYKVWDNLRVHPYNFDLSAMEDSVPLVLLNKFMGEKFSSPISTYVTSEFGPRHRRYHYGIDLGLKVGDSIRTPFDGMIRVVRVSQGYGNVIVVRHYNGLETIYGHLSKNLVFPNQEVKAGDVIALGGNTGRSTGPHLHLEVRYLGQPMNPRNLIDFSTFQLKNDTLLLVKNDFKHVYLAKKAREKSGSKSKGKYYTVRSGDTLSHIAGKYGTSIAKICKLNRISQSKTLRVGQRIKVR